MTPKSEVPSAQPSELDKVHFASLFYRLVRVQETLNKIANRLELVVSKLEEEKIK